MNPQNPLEQLRDIHLPDPIVWWHPNTPGWFIVFFLIALLCIYLYWHTIKNRKIKKQIHTLLNLPKEQRPLKIIMTLKAAAIKKAPQKANRLQGEQWVRWIENNGIKLNQEWNYWLSQGYLQNHQPPKDWYKKLSHWLKKLH
jgi:hypothetical protein